MLAKLCVKNFAIIEDIDIDFKDGLTVLTGETGAGKSLIIDSISLLLGERASLEMIRNGVDKAEIKGIFISHNKRLLSALNKLDIDILNDEIIISRTISPNKSVIKVNDKVITLSDLKNISKYLADIHQQLDMVKLLNKDNYLEMIDGFKYELISEYQTRYLDSLEELKNRYNSYQSLLKRIEDIKKEKDSYTYSLKELEAAHLDENEEEEINSRIELLTNYDKIYALLEENKELMDKDSLDDIYKIKENVNKLSTYQNEYQKMYESLSDHYYEIEAIYDDLKHIFNNLDYDPNELTELETRKNDLNLLKKKYHKSIPELIEYKNELESLLNNEVNLDETLKENRQELIEFNKKTYQKAHELSEIRKSISLSIEKELINNLQDLGLRVDFKIAFSTPILEDELDLSIYKDSGIDEVEFLIETNIGEGLKPLSKIVSGGEMSRIMFALKALFIKSQKISTVIFDEIDTGISGEIARKVALKIYDISLTSQVIAITHLPQVASLSTNHIKIYKHVVKGRTYTEIKELSLEEKIYEVASLISGNKVTNSQLEYAKEMILNKD